MTVLVLDLSSNNPHPIDYAAVKGAGVGAAIVKLTQGGASESPYVNPFAAEDVAGFRHVGLPVAGYHFFIPTIAVADQVALIQEHLEGVSFVWVDSETTEASWEAVAAATHAMCDALVPHVRTGLYSNPNFLENMPGAPWGYDLWLADYGPPAPPVRCLLWQYTASGTVAGVGGGVDLSHYYGTADELATLFGPLGTPPGAPGPAPTEEPMWIDELPVDVTEGGASSAKGTPILVVPGRNGYSILGPQFVAYYEANGIPKAKTPIAASDFQRLSFLGLV